MDPAAFPKEIHVYLDLEGTEDENLAVAEADGLWGLENGMRVATYKLVQIGTIRHQTTITWDDRGGDAT